MIEKQKAFFSFVVCWENSLPIIILMLFGFIVIVMVAGAWGFCLDVLFGSLFFSFLKLSHLHFSEQKHPSMLKMRCQKGHFSN